MDKVARRLIKPIYHKVRGASISVQNKAKFRQRMSSIPEYDLSEKNVLFLVVDCLRADHTSPRYGRDTTPFLAQLDGIDTTAVSAAPWTFPSVSSLLSGLYPHNHGAIYKDALRNQDTGNPPRSIRNDVYTLPELLAAADYETYLLTAIATTELPLRGRFRSQSVRHNARAADLVDDVLAWWESHEGAPRFAYVQFGDLHEPLRQPNSQPFGEISDIDGLGRWRFTQEPGEGEEFERYREERIRLYDTVLRTVDRELERLFEELEERDELGETIIVVTGDHGEEFWERESFEREHFYDPRHVYGTGHGHALIPEVLDVPLVVPGLSRAKPTSVSTVDITPTVLSELGFSSSDLETFDGTPLTIESPEPNRALLAEEIAYGYDQQAVIKGDHHLIHSPHEGETVLLNRSTDTIDDDSEALASLFEYTTTDVRAGDAVDIDETTAERLSDLGYM